MHGTILGKSQRWERGHQISWAVHWSHITRTSPVRSLSLSDCLFFSLDWRLEDFIIRAPPAPWVEYHSFPFWSLDDEEESCVSISFDQVSRHRGILKGCLKMELEVSIYFDTKDFESHAQFFNTISIFHVVWKMLYQNKLTCFILFLHTLFKAPPCSFFEGPNQLTLLSEILNSFLIRAISSERQEREKIKEDCMEFLELIYFFSDHKDTI